MPVDLQVRDVREALYWGAGGPAGCGDGRPSTLLLGNLFHETFAALVGQDEELHVQAALGEAEPDLDDWKHRLREHAYESIVGQRLFGDRAALQEHSDRVPDFWRATENMTSWLAEILFELWRRQRHFDRPCPEFFQDTTAHLSSEWRLVWEVRQPHWTNSVRLTGVADAVWWLPQRKLWCVLELKLGQTAPEADLAQACLYHQMLGAIGQQNSAFARTSASGPLALISFEPDCRERLLEPHALEEAQRRLVDLIGRLAGVLPESGAKAESPMPSSTRRQEPASDVNATELGLRLIRALEEYGAQVELDGTPIVGPTFIRYPLQLARGVKWKKVAASASELTHRMGLEQTPFIAVEGGRVVVDVQRPDRATVFFHDVADQLPRPDAHGGCSRIVLGVDLDGVLQTADLAEPENAHVLVAGTTGSGKSEWLRTVLAGLLSTNTPDTLRLMLIDPKRSAFHDLLDSPFLWDPNALVYPDEQPATEALLRLVEEMESRYRRLQGYDNLAHYQRETGEVVPRLVSICDEYFDLVNRDRNERKEIERLISRLGAKARAAGIHLIVATQRPDRETVKGALDANLPARVGLKVQKAIESKMVLQEPGAENLLGNGDLLFRNIGQSVRLQAPYLPPEERSKIFDVPDVRAAR